MRWSSLTDITPTHPAAVAPRVLPAERVALPLPRVEDPLSPVMDEQAGPGVFLSSCGKAPQQDEAAVGGEAARARYNVPEILRYMQHEWARFELERALWDVERAELQVKRVG